ncbi:UDP-glucose dehydrogenase family protein [Marinicrinis lubricantis]|uniref:UDP-glucose 6-dehydrogenase n=1 Tax=Marinicrinis lubricantis TaxID=2086470 RepID=A0ABW1IL54_9BACL
MNILVMGMGYVGITTALMLAESGWTVTGYDVDERKISSLKQGVVPFFEPGLDALLSQHLNSGQLHVTSSVKSAIKQNQVIFLCVGTPSLDDGSPDLKYIHSAAESIARYMQEYKLIVVKSTVPIGTNGRLTEWIASHQISAVPFDVVSNPEFLREGSALYDSLHPDRIVIGTDHKCAARQMRTIYNAINAPILITEPKTAEMIKYASNAFLATKISYMNELARLCDTLQIHIDDVAKGMGMDHRIGAHFLKAGIGYGGSCFPKDINALLNTASGHQHRLTILEQVVQVNNTQHAFYLDKWEEIVGGFRNKNVAVFGLSFKPDTDDLRESPSLSMISSLISKRASVKVHDPVAKLPAQLSSSPVEQCDSIDEAVTGADAIILCTDWNHYKYADWSRIHSLMKHPFLFDGKNALNRREMEVAGFHYFGIGQPYETHKLTSRSQLLP